nr:alpha/beta hydrolase [Mesorhizobium sp. WSM4875]
MTIWYKASAKVRGDGLRSGSNRGIHPRKGRTTGLGAFLARSVFALLVLAALNFSSPARADFARVSDDLTLHYQKSGHGPIPIVFVPGWTMSTAVFVKQFEHFANSDKYTFYSFDPRGQGLSSHTEGGHFYEQRGRDLKGFLDALGLKKVILAGWSYGALDVTSYLHESGIENLSAFILIDGTPRTVGDDNTKEWVWYNRTDSDEFRKFFTMPVLLDRQKANEDFAKWMLENPSPENLAWVSNISNQTSDTVAALTNEAGAYENYEADVKALEGKLPFMIFCRDEWRDTVQNWVTKNAPSTTMAVMGKHLMFWERPDQFNAALDGFLQKLAH